MWKARQGFYVSVWIVVLPVWKNFFQGIAIGNRIVFLRCVDRFALMKWHSSCFIIEFVRSDATFQKLVNVQQVSKFFYRPFVSERAVKIWLIVNNGADVVWFVFVRIIKVSARKSPFVTLIGSAGREDPCNISVDSGRKAIHKMYVGFKKQQGEAFDWLGQGDFVSIGG